MSYDDVIIIAVITFILGAVLGVLIMGALQHYVDALERQEYMEKLLKQIRKENKK